MDKKSVIYGAAKLKGLTRERLQKMSGIPPATFARRMANPDSITIAELRRLDQLAKFRDDQLIELVRGK